MDVVAPWRYWTGVLLFLFGLCDVAVLDTQDDVVAGAAAGLLLEELRRQ